MTGGGPVPATLAPATASVSRMLGGARRRRPRPAVTLQKKVCRNAPCPSSAGAFTRDAERGPASRYILKRNLYARSPRRHEHCDQSALPPVETKSRYFNQICRLFRARRLFCLRIFCLRSLV